MTPRQLAEKCFELKLATRPTYMSYKLMLEDNEWRVFMSAGIAPHAIQSEADDLAAISILRALLAILNDKDHAESRVKVRSFLVDLTYGDAKMDLQSLCLCLLRAMGVDVGLGKE